MNQIGYHRYEGFDLRTKFGWLQSAPGIEAVDSARRLLGSVGNGYLDSDDSVRNVLAGVGVHWQGRAAEAAGEAMQRAAGRAGVTGAAGGIGGGAVDGYGQSFEALRPKVHWEDPGSYGWDDTFWDVTGRQLDSAFGDVFDVQSDYYATAEENRTLEAQADAALYTHEAIARESLVAFPTLEPASALTAGAAPGGFSAIGPGGSPGGGFGGSGPAGAAVSVPAAGGTGPAGLVPDATTPGGFLSPGAARGGAGAATVPPATGGPVAGPSTALPGAAVPGGRVATPTNPIPLGAGAAISGVGPITTGPRGSGLGRPSVGAGGHGLPGSQRPSSGTEFGRRLGGPGGVPGPGAGGPLGSAGPGGTGGRVPSAAPEHAGPGSRPGASGPQPESRPQPGRAVGGPNAYGHPPFLAGMGAGSGPTEHKPRYWIPSSEAFDVDVPYTPPVIGGETDGQR